MGAAGGAGRFALFPFPSLGHSAPIMSKRPDILLICTDHWPGSLLGCAGHPCIQTPTLDSLAGAGRRFTRAYSECPVCIPARKTLMTGTSARTHGDRRYIDGQPWPDLPNLAGTFSAAGYQTMAVGKMHGWPQRWRLGFDDVILSEEGRIQWGVVDDYEADLARAGHPGEAFGHGMGNNHYVARPWHLAEELHVTHWATRQMCRAIHRRDPTRPALWYLSYIHPHPPLAPLASYLDFYRGVDLDEPFSGAWSQDPDLLPAELRRAQSGARTWNADYVREARRAFYALCTHIDHQLRLVIGTLRESGDLQNTVILFTSDHGDMLGNHGIWAKRHFLEGSANVPMILVDPRPEPRVEAGSTDSRLVGLQDVMPTLLDLAGIAPPGTVEGLSMVADSRRDHLYGEIDNGAFHPRMVHNGRHKLIYYPEGNRFQLFDLDADPQELHDLAQTPEAASVLTDLQARLAESLYGEDRAWVRDGRWTGAPEPQAGYWRAPRADPGLAGQRGTHFPHPQPRPTERQETGP